MTKLDISPLHNAMGQLQRSYDYLHSDLAKQNAGLREQFRAATIQAFEFTYELAIRMIRRRLAGIAANPDQLQAIDFADLMREAANAGLVREAQPFMGYREIRSKTSHTYNVEEAERVVAIVDGFLHDMRFLLAELEERNRATD